MKTTWVIGGTSGIGDAIADLLGDYDDRNVYSSGADDADVRSMRHLEQMYVDITNDNGELSEIVYCAGINKLDKIQDMDYGDVKNIFDINVLGFMRVMTMMARREAPGCRVAVVSSDAAHRPMRTSMAYCASKAALNMAVRCAARELGPAGYRINGIGPGMTAPTGMSEYIDATVPDLRGWTTQEMLSYEMQQAVVKRRASPMEVAQMVRQVLESPDYLNGAIIDMNGGR